MIHTINDFKVGQQVVTKYDKCPWRVTKISPGKEKISAMDKGGILNQLYPEEINRIVKN